MPVILYHTVSPSVFRDYDIRGIYPDDINEDSFYIIGRSIAQYLKVKEIAVGRDCRLSSKSLFDALARGLLDSGVNVVDLGLISAEIHNFASGFYKFPANIIISASHNPPQYNGMKILTAGVVALHGENGLPEIRELALAQKFPTPINKGNIRKVSIIDEWIKHALTFIDINKLKKLKVVVDGGNGMAGISWVKIAEKLPLEIIPLYFEPDGRFPHHLPDPLNPKNLLDLQKTIREKKADLGIAIDGDADRFFALDENGKSVSGTIITTIIADYLLHKYGPCPVLYNAVCGRIVAESVKKARGKPVRVRVGHSFIKEAMKSHKALFAGEHSGHFYFQQNYYADSSLITGLILLEIISSTGLPFSEIIAPFDKYYSSGEINFKVKDIPGAEKGLETKFKDALSIDHLDGLSVFYSNWWFNLRASKTEPLLRFNLEADTSDILHDKMEIVEKYLKTYGSVADS